MKYLLFLFILLFSKFSLYSQQDTVNEHSSKKIKINFCGIIEFININNYVINSNSSIALAPFDDINSFQLGLEAYGKLSRISKNIYWNSIILYSKFGGKFYPNNFTSKKIFYNNLSVGLGLSSNRDKKIFLSLNGIYSKSLSISEKNNETRDINWMIKYNIGYNLSSKVFINGFLMKSYRPHFEIIRNTSTSQEFWNIFGIGLNYNFE